MPVKRHFLTEGAPLKPWPQPLAISVKLKGAVIGLAVGILIVAASILVGLSLLLWPTEFGDVESRRLAWIYAGCGVCLGMLFVAAMYDERTNEISIAKNVLRIGGRLTRKSVHLRQVAAWHVDTIKVKHLIPVGKYLFLSDANGDVLTKIDLGVDGVESLASFIQSNYPHLDVLRAKLLSDRTAAAEKAAARRGDTPPALARTRWIGRLGALAIFLGTGGLAAQGILAFQFSEPVAQQAMVLLFAAGVGLSLVPYVVFSPPILPLDPGALVIGGILGWCSAFMGASFLNPWPLFGLGIAVGMVPMMIVATKARLAPKPAGRVFQLFMVLLATASLPFHANRAFDHGKAKIRKTTVTAKLTPGADKLGYVRHTIEFENPYKPGSSNQLTVTAARFAEINVGDLVELPEMPGALGSPWVPEAPDD